MSPTAVAKVSSALLFLMFLTVFVSCKTTLRGNETTFSSSSNWVRVTSFLENHHHPQQQHQQQQQASSSQLPQQEQERRHLTTVQREPIAVEDDPEFGLLSALTEKLNSPRELTTEEHDHVVSLTKNQFLHLHHMKTGGTSIDALLNCARSRLERDRNLRVPYGNIHECSRTMYIQCKSGQDRRCIDRLANASLMSYCAPLKDLPYFQWGTFRDNGKVGVTVPPSHGAITVLRHPVDRVWSMFRFQTRPCFKCMPLTKIYEMMDAGNLKDLEPTCYQQLQNHQVANLLSSEWLHLFDGTNNSTYTLDDNAMVDEAIENMKSFFTVIGLTEQLGATVEIIGRVFPWMNATVDWSDRQCTLTHANASPKNNGCGENHGHWYLPDVPDDETRAVIEAHNQLDMKLYAAAVEHFELQKRAIGYDMEQE